MNGTLMAVMLYTAYAVFLGRVVWKSVLLLRSRSGGGITGAGRQPAGLLPKAVLDILFLSRLFRANPMLWIWEWLFHLCFVIVALRHLRFFLHPVPRWIFSLETAGYIAGWLMPFTLLVILIIKVREERCRYLLRSNFFILAVIFLLGVTGLLMRTVFPTDIVAVKTFVIDTLLFSPGQLSGSGIFTIHLVLASVLLVFIPTHVFAAPYTLYEARKRDESRKRVMYDQE